MYPAPCWGPSTLQPRGHGVSEAHRSPLGRGHSDIGPLPCRDAAARPRGNLLLLLHKSHLCVPSRWQGPSLGEEVQQLLKRQQHRMGTARGRRCLLLPGSMGCPLPLLASALPSPSAREATYKKAVAGPQTPTQPPVLVPNASPSKRSSIHRRSRRQPQECVSSLAS